METKLSMVMQNLLATCWFFMINMCCTRKKNIFHFVIGMLYNKCIFFFFHIFPHRKVDTE